MTDFSIADLQHIRQMTEAAFDQPVHQSIAFWLVIDVVDKFAARPVDAVAITASDDLPDWAATPIPWAGRPIAGNPAGNPETTADIAETAPLASPPEPEPEAKADPAEVPDFLKRQTARAPAKKSGAAKTVTRTGMWSQQELDYLLAAREQGQTYGAIAAHLGRSQGSVNAKHYNMTHQNKAPEVPPANRWTAKSEAELLSCAASGGDLAVLAARLGKSEAALKSKLFYIKSREPARWSTAERIFKEVGVSPASDALAHVSKAEGGLGVLPQPCPDAAWPIEDDFDLVEMHQSGVTMADVAINLERHRQSCVDRYKALIEAMPEGDFLERQTQLKDTLAFYVAEQRQAA